MMAKTLKTPHPGPLPIGWGEGQSSATRPKARFILPWVVGGGGLVVYLLTLNHWISLQSLGIVARLSGWVWQPAVNQPLTLAVLYPFSLLPSGWSPMALNLFTALCGASTLALLARSVMLLPHDLSPAQPFQQNAAPSLLSIPSAWVPPVLAAVLCGLQLSFWEHATAATGEMINLLVFAYVIRCLLEFRIDQNLGWLYRCALVYGAGMANDWAMIGYFPLFLAAVFRAKNFGPFFDRRFLLRMSLCGLVGLSLYLLLPAVQSLSAGAEMDFWTALKAHVKFQKSALVFVRNPTLRTLVVAELLPIVLLSIRWKSHTMQFSDDSRLGVFLTKTSVHFLHGFCLIIALWIGLDPAFSPRHLNLGTSLLTAYYLSALVFGYCAGYFLLLGVNYRQSNSGAKPGSTLPRSILLCRKLLRLTLHGLPYALLVLLPVALAWRNLGQMRLTNGTALRAFASQIYADLPAGNSVVLSDDATQLYLLRAEMNGHKHEKSPLLLESSLLPFTGYQKFIARNFNCKWPAPISEKKAVATDRAGLLNLVWEFATTEPVIYLDRGISYFCEQFGPESHGTVEYLVVPGAGDGTGSAKERIIAQQELWERWWNAGPARLTGSVGEQRKHDRGWQASLLRPLRLASETNSTLSFVGMAYSKALDTFGVKVQRLGQWREAQVWFQHALELNPENLAAQINLEYARRRQVGNFERLDLASLKRDFSDLFAKYNRWGQVLASDGPVDEPSFLFTSGHVFLGSGNARQATQAFARCAELAPQWVAPKLWLAQCHLRLQDFERALQATHAVEISSQSPDATSLAELLYCQATALCGVGKTNEATEVLQQFATRAPNRNDVLNKTVDLFLQGLQYDQELIVLEAMLKREPDRSELLKRKGVAQIQLQQYDAAISTLSRALSVDPADNEARLNRARAYFEAGQLEAASADYQALLSAPSESRSALFGLAGIAWRKGETNAAVEFYEQYLAKAASQSRQYALAAQRLRELKGANK